MIEQAAEASAVSKSNSRTGKWAVQAEWQTGVRIATANVNSKGRLMKLLAFWASQDMYDLVLVQEHHEASHAGIEEAARRARKWGWHSTWTPAIAKSEEGTTGGTAIFWKAGLPVHAEQIQGGVVRARGRSTMAVLTWPKIKPIEFVSLYFEAGGKINELNLQMAADLHHHFVETGNLYWAGGDFQVEPEELNRMEWPKLMQGSLRVGERELGTCTIAKPANTIDYHLVHHALDNMTGAAQVDLRSDLSPHRPVTACLRLVGGQAVPVQKVRKLPHTPTIGPRRKPPDYSKVESILDALEQPGTLDDLKKNCKRT